jgi:hypothetical protein
MPANSAEKLQLTITRVFVSRSGSLSLDNSAVFKAMLNPSDFSHGHAITYNTRKTLGQVGSDPRFAAVEPDRVAFTLVLDGTGAVPKTPGEQRMEVEDQVKTLNGVVYKYVGSKHEPGHVRVLWGTLILYGRLSWMNISYTLFKPNGDPLRAKVSLNFTGFMSNKEAEAAAGRSSPDLSHVVEVRDGDTLPLLCNRIYGDPAYYAEVARFNGLREFRRLKPGSQLRFPPLT